MNPGKFPVRGWHTATVFALLLAASGCAGMFGGGSRAARTTVPFSGPDKCSRCHEAWAKRFDYYRGWDRYGCVFEGAAVTGWFDPWLFPSIRNTAREYYGSEWWDTPETYAWPGDIADRAESLSILSRGGFPVNPASRDSLGGKAVVVSGDGDTEFTRIQQAVDAAPPGYAIFVKSGTYNETVTLRENTRLIGEDPYTTIIDPKNGGHGIIAANHCLITGFTLTGTGIDYTNNRMNAGIFVPGCDSTLVITGNIFRENGLFGIFVEGELSPGKNAIFERAHPGNTADYADRPYETRANPVIAGNTFYRIGQRAIFCVHSRGEIFNNIFIGNVKTIGMERHARPFIHHNVFYLNNITMSVNRSEPIICDNIMYRNQWGQRMLKGANPAIFGNVTWQSPHFRDFDEAGRPVPYRPIPGTAEMEGDPLFVNPAAGDFHFKRTSPFHGKTLGFGAAGIMRDESLPQPPQLACANSYGREVLALTPDILDLIRIIDEEEAKIRSVEAAYRIEYTGFLTIAPDADGLPVITGHTGEKPAVTLDYTVSRWNAGGGMRVKIFQERVTGAETFSDSGTVLFNGSNLDIRDSRFAKDFSRVPDARFIGDRPFREAPLGIYRDYDQYYRGAIGPMGTFYSGYLRMLGGRIAKRKVLVEDRACIDVRYPHIGNDQYYRFLLDPARGYRPMKLVQYCNGKPFRVIDSYRYAEFPGGIFMPVSLRVTDYAVAGRFDGRKTGEWTLAVTENSLRVNGNPAVRSK